MKHGSRITTRRTTRRRFLKQGVAFGLAGAGLLSARAIAGGLPAPAGAPVTASTNASSAGPVYVFASDPRAGLSGFQTIPG